MSEQLSQNCIYFINMLRAQIHDAELPELTSEIDHDALYSISEAQGLSCMVYHGLYRLGFERIKESAAANFRRAHRAYVKLSIIQELEYNRLAAAMDAEGVDFMPLKGWYTRELYPETVMRYMGDVDVLVHPDKLEQVHELMIKLGYACDDYRKHESDNYRKGGMVFEMHYELDNEGVKDPSVFADPFGMAKCIGGHCWQMLPTYAYLYTVVHGMKHFMNSGTGLRTLLDIYLYLKKCELDRNTIETLAKRMGIERFLHAMESLAQKTFGEGRPLAEGELDSDSVELLSFMLRSGAGGKSSTLDAVLLDRSGRGGKGGSKLSLFFRMLFPSMKTMQRRDPILKKAPILLPFMYIRRWFQLIFCRRKNIKKGLARYNALDEEAVDRMRNIHRLAGLD